MSRLRAIRDDRGSVLPLVGLMMFASVATAATTIDLGMLYVARAELQRGADAAALAGGVALAEAGHDAGRAQRIAVEYGARNTARGMSIALLAADVVVTDTVVRIHAQRSAERGSAVPTWFAGVFGVHAVDVSAQAVSRVTPTGAATCLDPFLVPDAWQDGNGNRTYDAGEYYETRVTGYGTGYRGGDAGRQLTITVGTTGVPVSADWYFLLRLPASSGGDDIRRAIGNPACDPRVGNVGDALELDREPGTKTGPVAQGIDDLIATDPKAWWDAASRTIRDSAYGDGWSGSPRVLRIAFLDPRETVEPGTKPVKLMNFGSFFIEKQAGGKITGRLLPVVGVPQNEDCRVTASCAPFARAVRLAG